MMTIQDGARRLTIAALAVLVLGASACDDLLREDPPHVLTADNLYSTPAGFQNGLAALYAHARRELNGLGGNNVNQPQSLFARTGVDNAFGDNDDVPRVVNISRDWQHPRQGLIFRYWEELYEAINAANTLIARAENPALGWTAEEKNRVVGEARLIRAWAYRHVAYLWGDAPLHLTESRGSEIRTDWERAPLADVQKQIEADLLFAEQHLPMVPARDGRVSKAVALHYLAELYLWMNQPVRAEEKAAAVVNSGQYSLMTNRYGVRATQPGHAFMDQFYDGNVLRSQGNREVLWAMQFEQNVPGGGANFLRRAWASTYHSIRGIALSVEHGGRGQRRALPTRWAVELYCFGDSSPAQCLTPGSPKSRTPDDRRGDRFSLRRFYIYNNASALPAGRKLGDTLWLEPKRENVDDHQHITTRKWEWADPTNLAGSESYGDIPYLRVADTYLLLAEAQLKQGKLAQAAETINKLRARAGASLITPAQVTLAFILDERSRELLAEEHRRYTLVRTGTFYERTRAHNPVAAPMLDPHHVLFPIPTQVIDANLTRPMANNPGY